MSDWYKSHPSGIEAIEITQYESFLRGNILKYIMRAPYKGTELEDLEKAAEYLQWEIERVKEDQFWAKFDEGVVKPRLADLFNVDLAWDDETTKSREKLEKHFNDVGGKVAKRLEELGVLRDEWDSDENIGYVADNWDYYRAGMTKTFNNVFKPGQSNYRIKPFDEVVFPDKCQECDGDCKVCA